MKVKRKEQSNFFLGIDLFNHKKITKAGLRSYTAMKLQLQINGY